MTKFSIVLGLSILCLLAFLALWVTRQATVDLLDAMAENGARFVRAELEPKIQSLESSPTLSEGDLAAIQATASELLDGEAFVNLKVWRTDGTAVYATFGSTDIDHAPEELAAALVGNVVGKLPDLDEEEHADERHAGIRMYEIYAPLYSQTTGEIIAVGEIYQNASHITDALLGSVKGAMSGFFAVGFATVGLLMAVVVGGNRVINRQQDALVARYEQQIALSEANARLHKDIEIAREQSDTNELHLQKRIGADLHDGACQLLAALRLSLDRVTAKLSSGDYQRAKQIVDDQIETVDEVLAEVRAVSAGLSAPFLEGTHTVRDVIVATIRDFNLRCHENVDFEFEGDDLAGSQILRNTVGRVVQEALTNAHKYAPGSPVLVSVRVEPDRLVFSVSDQGATDAVTSSDIPNGKLGVRGMQLRIESLGGRFELRENKPQGMTMSAAIPTNSGAIRDQ